MTRRGVGSLLCALALPLFVVAGYCFYKATVAGITAEEGLKYSLPAMKASREYSSKYVADAEFAFRNLDHVADEWNSRAGYLLLLCGISATAGIALLGLSRRNRPDNEINDLPQQGTVEKQLM